jgi:NADPH:quinone reductase-like Zn-dependent oxidoreductase
MRAYELSKGGAGIDALVEVEGPDPKPAYRQILVKVKACSLNFRDLAIARGSYRMSVRENVIPLSDGAGEVVEIGPGVTKFKVGDRVAGISSNAGAVASLPRTCTKAPWAAVSTACSRTMRYWRKTAR